MILPLKSKWRHDNPERYMKLSKTTFLAALMAASLFAAGSALGQNATTNAPAAGASTKAPRSGRMDVAKMLNLTDDQKAKVQPILDAQRTKARAVFQDDSLSQDDKRTKLKAIHDETAAQLKPILTPEQFATWQKMQTRMRRMSPPGGNAPAPSAPPAPAAPPQQ
jgi:Spy/CpxP family protein refolding chaperone